MHQIIPIKDLKNTSQISIMCNETVESIFITKNSYGDMVIMSMKTYEEKMLMQDVYTKLEMTEPNILDGKTFDAFDSLEGLKKPANTQNNF